MRLFSWLMVCLLLAAIPASLGAQEDRLAVVASHSILADVVQNVAGDAADVSSLLPRSADPHSYTPTPRDLVSLAEADVVFTNGASFEAGLLKGIENAAQDITIVEASQCVEIRAIGSADYPRRAAADPGPCEALYAEAQVPHHDETLGLLMDIDCDEDHACDPHIWMNPQNVMLWALTIRDTLSALDPAHAEVYAQNAAAYIAQLSELQSEIAAHVQTIPPENRVLVTNHDSLGYFAAQYGFQIIGVVIPGGSTVAEPSAKDIVNLIGVIEAAHTAAVFAETTVNPAVAQQVADESGAFLVLLYSGSLSDEDGPASTYLDYMRYNVGAIVDGLD